MRRSLKTEKAFGAQIGSSVRHGRDQRYLRSATGAPERERPAEPGVLVEGIGAARWRCRLAGYARPAVASSKKAGVGGKVRNLAAVAQVTDIGPDQPKIV
jgi:hypothetical protein